MHFVAGIAAKLSFYGYRLVHDGDRIIDCGLPFGGERAAAIRRQDGNRSAAFGNGHFLAGLDGCQDLGPARVLAQTISAGVPEGRPAFRPAALGN